MINLMKSQIDATVEMLQNTIGKFDEVSWKTGFGQMHYPWKIAWHTVACLEEYFSPGVKLKAGGHFGRPWGEMPAPSIAAMQAYLNEVRAKIEQRVQIDGQRDLSEMYDPDSSTKRNVLEHYVYAIRHTMHHHGALAALAVKAGTKEIITSMQ